MKNYKIIFYKEWNQIGCKYLENATVEDCQAWLETNHDMSRIKKVVLRNVKKEE